MSADRRAIRLSSDKVFEVVSSSSETRSNCLVSLQVKSSVLSRHKSEFYRDAYIVALNVASLYGSPTPRVTNVSREREIYRRRYIRSVMKIFVSSTKAFIAPYHSVPYVTLRWRDCDRRFKTHRI